MLLFVVSLFKVKDVEDSELLKRRGIGAKVNGGFVDVGRLTRPKGEGIKDISNTHCILISLSAENN